MELLVCNALRGACRVVVGADGDAEAVQELLALSDPLRMRPPLRDTVDLRARKRDRAVVDAHDRLADEVEPVPEEEVVGLVDAAGLGVVHRHETERGESHFDSHEDASDRRERSMREVRKERAGTLLRVRPGLALIRDGGVHARTLQGPDRAGPLRFARDHPVDNPETRRRDEW
jgi:hypothetical protein